MTETSPGGIGLDAADAERKLGSAGKPVMYTEVKVVDEEGTKHVLNLSKLFEKIEPENNQKVDFRSRDLTKIDFRFFSRSRIDRSPHE